MQLPLHKLSRSQSGSSRVPAHRGIDKELGDTRHKAVRCDTVCLPCHDPLRDRWRQIGGHTQLDSISQRHFRFWKRFPKRPAGRFGRRRRVNVLRQPYRHEMLAGRESGACLHDDVRHVDKCLQMSACTDRLDTHLKNGRMSTHAGSVQAVMGRAHAPREVKLLQHAVLTERLQL